MVASAGVAAPVSRLSTIGPERRMLLTASVYVPIARLLALLQSDQCPSRITSGAIRIAMYAIHPQHQRAESRLGLRIRSSLSPDARKSAAEVPGTSTRLPMRS
jgi:hypothetical protein